VRGLLLCGLTLFAINAGANEAKIWRIDSSNSQAQMSISLRIPVHPVGKFKTISGELTQLPEQKMSVRLQIDVQDLQMNGPSWVQKSTVSKQFLDSQSHPRIDFQSIPFSNQLLISGGDIKGQLTIKGQAQPVVFVVASSTCHRPGFTCPVMGKGMVNRNDFAMTAYRWTVRDEVQFSFQLKFTENE
jgi:polyisoprenoid-binding protein YceI